MGDESSIDEEDTMGQAASPVQRAPTSALSSEPVHRFYEENIERSAESEEPEMIEKGQTGLPQAVEQKPVVGVELAEPSPSSGAVETMFDQPDRATESGDLSQQPVPLQAVWNVQRLQAPETGSDEPVSLSRPEKALPDQSVYPHKPKGAGPSAESIQRMALEEEGQSLMTMDRDSSPLQPSLDRSHALVEILPPSRPRPAGASLASPRPAVQRQPENMHAADGIHEPTLVDTAIGPLPSDLWSLLGQKPPVSSGPRDVQRQTPVHTSSAESSGDQETFLHEYSVAPAGRADRPSHPPAVLQRQAEASLPATGPGQEQASLSGAAEEASSEPDLQDLAQKVYAEVRRRLATESERTHRYV
jgi:hypothetical protein